MTAKELFFWALSRESLVSCIRAGSALAHSQQSRFLSAMLIFYTRVWVGVCCWPACVRVFKCVVNGDIMVQKVHIAENKNIKHERMYVELL